VVTLQGVFLFIDSDKVIDPVVTAHLVRGGVEFHPYGFIEKFLKVLDTQGNVIVDPTQLNWRLYQVSQILINISILMMTSLHLY
jgi:hypothetical protein